MGQRADGGWRRAAWLLVLVPFAIAYIALTSETPSEAPREPDVLGSSIPEPVTLGDAGADPSVSSAPDAGATSRGPVAPVRLSEPTVRRDPSVRAGALAGTVRAWASGRGVEGAELTFEHRGTRTP